VFNEEGKSVEVGAPFVKGATVTAKVVSHQKGDKINVLKFHRKNRYERNN
jgi:large subunit ribosomal protein L21